MSELTEGPEKLLGLLFHNYKEDNPLVIYNQGRVISYLENGYYLVQLFEWLMGTESNQKIFHISKMITWDFYTTPDDMHDAYDHYDKTRP